MLLLAGALRDPSKAGFCQKPSPPLAPRLSLNCAFFRTGRRKCVEAGAELISGRKVRRKNRNRRRNQKRRNNGHGGTEFCKSRAMGAGLSLFRDVCDGVELRLVDLSVKDGQLLDGCVYQRACGRGVGRADPLRPPICAGGAEPCNPPGRTDAPRQVLARGFDTDGSRYNMPPTNTHALYSSPTT